MKKKELKQTSLFTRLKKQKVSFSLYGVLYKLYNDEPVKEEILEKIPKLYYDQKLTEEAIKVLISIDDLFAPKKKLKIEELLGPNFAENIERYNQMFPKEKIDDRFMRNSQRNLEVNFRWFFENNSFTWEQIFNATDLMLKEFRMKNYKYMRNSLYFIKKQDAGRMILSDLATYCERHSNSGDYVPETFFKTKVI